MVEQWTRFAQGCFRLLELSHEREHPAQPYQGKAATKRLVQSPIQLHRSLEHWKRSGRRLIEESAEPEISARLGGLRCVGPDTGHGGFEMVHALAKEAKRRPR